MIYFKIDRGVLHQGHVMDVLKEMPPESCHCVISSPPYWSLRSYLDNAHPDKPYEIGLEKTPEEYIEKIVQVFREVKRVLHRSGTVWINLGDSYAGSGSPGGDFRDGKGGDEYLRPYNRKGNGLKPKDLCGIPWRVALALQADGWWLRSAIPWCKRSSMPESCTDRPASALEYVFLLAKSQHYFFDMDAIRIPHKPESIERCKHSWDGNRDVGYPGSEQTHDMSKMCSPGGRNFRNTDLFYESITPPHGMISTEDELIGVDVNPQAMKAAHFATFPEKLVEPCLKAGTSEKGCCPECLEPYVRMVERVEGKDISWKQSEKTTEKHQGRIDQGLNSNKSGFNQGSKETYYKNAPRNKTIGWKRNCTCLSAQSHYGFILSDMEKTIPCTVLDPFAGSCTVGVVAEKYRRNWVGIELSEDYAKLAENRVRESIKQRRLF